MFFGLLTLFTALAMAGVAAWFAIAGIMAVFSGAPIPALVMGAVIELGKIVGVSWIYRNNGAKTKLRYFMFPLVIVSMLLTSMGIFGYLSKAHLQQGAPIGNNVAQIERIDQRIAKEQYTITDSETVMGQLDQTVTALVKNDRISGPNGARAVREGQADQRAELKKTIEEAQQNISKLEDEKFQLSQAVRQHELEVGPVKYIAELIYSDAKDRLESAVRVVIIAFIFVFDPMAIMLLMAANYTLMQRKKPKTDDEEDEDEEESDEPSPTITSIEQLGKTLPPGITVDEIRGMISTLNEAHELTEEEIEQRDALQQLLNQRTVRNKIRTKG